jgi:hypothetical protein
LLCCALQEHLLQSTMLPRHSVPAALDDLVQQVQLVADHIAILFHSLGAPVDRGTGTSVGWDVIWRYLVQHDSMCPVCVLALAQLLLVLLLLDAGVDL